MSQPTPNNEEVKVSAGDLLVELGQFQPPTDIKDDDQFCEVNGLYASIREDLRSASGALQGNDVVFFRERINELKERMESLMSA